MLAPVLLVFVPCLLLAALAGGAPLLAQAPSDGLLRVTTAADPGDGLCDATCSLRDAILAANDRPGPDRIAFAVGAGAVRIHPRSPLPALDDAGTVIDGSSQPGYGGRPLIYLDGSSTVGASGLVSRAPDVEFRALAVGGFEGFGLVAIGEDADNNRFLGNWLGMAMNGIGAAANGLSGLAVLAGADGALIGAPCPGCGNRAAGNSVVARTGHGILVGGHGTVGARLRNNVLGINGVGQALPNDDGILIVDGAQATIGGAAPGDGNIVAGSRVAGIELRGTHSFLSLRVEGNRIGLDETGLRALPNDVGLFLNGGARNVQIGAGFAGAGNIVAGNRVGIAIEDRAEVVTVQGNHIGFDIHGAPLPNSEDGISIVAGAHDVRIGGRAAGEPNYIGGGLTGIDISGAATRRIRIVANHIGLAPDGRTLAASVFGIRLREAEDVVIGGARADANVIVAATDAGVLLEAVAQAAVRANRVGLGPDDVPLGNNVGVRLRDGASDNLVQENRIGGNRGAGIEVLGVASQRNKLTRNVFLDNAGLGIDLGGDGPTPNDARDRDAGPNALLNAPAITGVDRSGRLLRISGTAAPRRQVELYTVIPTGVPSVTPHSSGFGAGADLLGIARTERDGSWQMTVPVPAGTSITALSLDGGGNTSEFARNVFPLPPVQLRTGFTPAGWFGPPTAAADAFAPLGDRFQAAFRFDAATQTWQMYRPGPSFLSSLEALAPGDALWILLGAGGRRTWTQPDAPAQARTLALEPGLNFVAWTGPPTPLLEALGVQASGGDPSALGGALQTAFRWNSRAARFDTVFPRLPGAGPVTLFPHDLLWLRLSAAASWPQPALHPPLAEPHPATLAPRAGPLPR